MCGNIADGSSDLFVLSKDTRTLQLYLWDKGIYAATRHVALRRAIIVTVLMYREAEIYSWGRVHVQAEYTERHTRRLEL